MKKSAYAHCLCAFFVLIATYTFLFDRVSAYTPVTEHLQDTVIITAVVQSAIAPEYPPISTPPRINEGVPLTIDSGTDTAIFKGMSYPGSIISLLKNGIIVAEMPASPNGTFEIRLRGLNPGTYNFGIRAEDSERLKSNLELFTIFISYGVTTVVDGIFISPTITTDKIWVKQGDPIAILGRAVPNAYVSVTIHSDTMLLKKTKANASGGWIYKLDSAELELGDHKTKARASTDDDISSLSEEVGFIVGNETRIRTEGNPLGLKAKCDLNNDYRVNLQDFSIMAFWYKRLGFPTKVDLNDDSLVNLTDFSILAWCWTG